MTDRHYHRRIAIVGRSQVAYLPDQGVPDRAPDQATAAILARRSACSWIAAVIDEGGTGTFRTEGGVIVLDYTDADGRPHTLRYEVAECHETHHQEEPRHVAVA